jgi:hypothetical protein
LIFINAIFPADTASAWGLWFLMGLIHVLTEIGVLFDAEYAAK